MSVGCSSRGAAVTRPTRTVTSPSVSTRSRSALGMTCRSLAIAAIAASPSDRVGGPGQVAQPERHGHRLVVVEQQRGQPPAGAEGVAAVAAGGALDGVAEVAQAGHIAPQGPSGVTSRRVRQIGR